VTPWSTRYGAVEGGEDAGLQFGHGGDAVEHVTIPLTPEQVASGFNSATAVTPWSTRTRVPRGYSSAGFNSATAVTPWSTVNLTVFEPVGETRFNSATAVTPWSTDPEAWLCSDWSASFNSATAVTPWSTAVTNVAVSTANALQFGHGGDAVEHGAHQEPAGPAREASIRPRR
jgi:hypothetical protein